MLDDEIAIRSIFSRWSRAVHAGDVDTRTRDYAEDVVMFDAMVPLRRSGIEGVRTRMREWLDGYSGPVGYEVRDLTVELAGDLAVTWGLDHITGMLKTGQEVDMWVRATNCFRRGDEGWQVIHSHISAPFDQTGKAAMAIKP